MSTTISGTNGVTFPDSTSMQTGQQACKAWVNFNGTGTVAIRDAYNVSSITDNGTGNYTVNFTTAMADTNYSVSGCSARTCGKVNTNRVASCKSVCGLCDGYSISRAPVGSRSYRCRSSIKQSQKPST